MTILSQFYKNELKERIKNKIFSISEEMIDSILNNLGSLNSKNHYLDFISEIEEKSKEIIRMTIAEFIEELDYQFKTSYSRKKLYNINKSNVSRTIITIVGDITFKRTCFISKLDHSYYFYIDSLFELPKYDHYDPIVKGIAIDKAIHSNQAIAGRDTGELLSNLNVLSSDNRTLSHISRQTVRNWIIKWKNPKLKYEQVNTPETLYIMGDEKFIGCQDLDNDIMAKCFVSFEGVEKIGKNRNKLINRTIYSTYSKVPWDEFINILVQKYDFSKIKNIFLISDAGRWLKTGITELKLEPNNVVNFLLCEFHYKQAINRITTDKEKRLYLLKLFNEKSKKQFENEVLELIKEHPDREKNISKNLEYILNNYNAIKAMLKNPIGSSMESHISHYIASLFASRPKGFSSKYIKQYLELNDYNNNGFNVFNLYMQTYFDKENRTINDNEINYSIFDKNTSNIPILNNGQITGTYNNLKKIIYN